MICRYITLLAILSALIYSSTSAEIPKSSSGPVAPDTIAPDTKRDTIDPMKYWKGRGFIFLAGGPETGLTPIPFAFDGQIKNTENWYEPYFGGSGSIFIAFNFWYHFTAYSGIQVGPLSIETSLGWFDLIGMYSDGYVEERDGIPAGDYRHATINGLLGLDLSLVVIKAGPSWIYYQHNSRRDPERMEMFHSLWMNNDMSWNIKLMFDVLAIKEWIESF